MLYGMSLLFGVSGTTVLSEIADSIEAGNGSSSVMTLGIVFVIAGFAFKVSAVPFHTWAPDVYEGAPTPVTAFLSVASMGGLRKVMPQTYRTFIIGSIALAGLPPFAGFWSKDEILVGTGGWGIMGGTNGNGSYTFMLVMGMITAALTAAYMTRCVYLTFFGEFRGHGNPHESGPRITIPLWILAVLAVFAGFLNLPKGFQLVPESLQERFGHYVEPVAGYFPKISHATPSWSLAIISTIIVVAGISLAWNYYFVKVEKASKESGQSLTELPDGLTTRLTIARMGHTLLVNKYYLDHLYTGIITRAVKEPIAELTYRSNQEILDRTVDTVCRTAVRVAQLVLLSGL